MRMRTILTATALMLATTTVLAQQAADAVDPEVGGAGMVATLSDEAMAAQQAKADGEAVSAETWMVSAANPLAVQAGADVLREGGSAADAMVAVQAVLGLVEPQSSGLGGGAFLVWYDAQTGELTTLDGRETAPMAANPRLFQNEDGEPLGFFDAVVGGLSVGTPGTPALMEDAHRRWGQANWGQLLQPAIDLAEGGFEVSPRLAASVAGDQDRLSTFPRTRDYFFPGGAPIAEGSILVNEAYAETLRAMAKQGASALYSGPIAEGIVDTVRSAEGNPGLLAMEDLARYRVVERPAVCAEYRQLDVCGMGPPSSGALTVGQILGMAGAFDLPGLGPDRAESWRIIGDASRLAFADRGRYMADSDFVPMPTEGLVDPDYLAERAELLAGDDALPQVAPGNPEWSHASLWADDESLELPSTSHISIVDA
ncbi:MAG: gamma-glutamyltransferase, partial [Pseudomonadota bacterium]